MLFRLSFWRTSQVRRPDELGGHQLGRGTLEDHAPEVKDVEVLADAKGERQVVLDQENPDAALGHELL
jgi:hypothetical protein